MGTGNGNVNITEPDADVGYESITATEETKKAAGVQVNEHRLDLVNEFISNLN